MGKLRADYPAYLALLFCVCAPGCDSGFALPCPVFGKVSYRGAPLHTGTVVFIPDVNRGGSGPIARADVQMDGSYLLQTGESAGAAPGWYRVTIAALDTRFDDNTQDGFAIPMSLIPEKYRDPTLSGLVCEVKVGQENRIDFDLQ
jgi:hypothetical protein